MKKLNSIIILLLPLVIYYDFPFTSINIATVLSLVLLIVSTFLVRQKNFRINKGLLFVLIYVVCSTILTLIFRKTIPFVHFAFIIVNIIISILITGNIRNTIDVSCLVKHYKRILCLLIFIFILQHLTSLITGRIMYGLIPFLPITDSYKGVKTGLSIETYSYFASMRLISSSFSEPAHFAVYLLPAFVISLREKKKLNWAMLIITSLTVLMTLSGNGILSMIIFFLAFLLLDRKLSIAKRAGGLIAVCLFFFLTFLILNRISVFNELFSNLFSGDLNRGSKADYRIFRGFYIFGTLPVSNKLFGLGFHQITDYLTLNNLATPYDYGTSNLEYANFIAQYLIYFGIIGFIFPVAFVYQLFRKGNHYSNAFLITMIALWFSSSMMFDSIWIFLLTFVVAFNCEEWSVYYAVERKKRFVDPVRIKVHSA